MFYTRAYRVVDRGVISAAQDFTTADGRSISVSNGTVAGRSMATEAVRPRAVAIATYFRAGVVVVTVSVQILCRCVF